jgi:very-short-patch-repair endonuclease
VPDPVELLTSLGGVARAGRLATSGGERRRLAALVAAGQVIAHPGGCYSLPGADRDMVRALVARAALTCVSAARLHGLAVLPAAAQQTHVAVPHRHGSPAARRGPTGSREVVVHRERPGLLTAHPHPRAPDSGPWVVAPAESLARMLRCGDPLAAIAAVDSALNRRTCTVRDVAALLTGPGSPGARGLLEECDGRSVSAIESVARVVLRRAGYRAEPGVRISGVGFVDLLVEGRVVVELDGFAYHHDRHAYREDRRRDRELAAQGYIVLRFTWEDVVGDPARVVESVGACLRRGDEPGRPRH